MKKIALIEIKSKAGNVFEVSKMPRLGLPGLGAYLEEAGYDVALYAATVEKLKWHEILQADLVGLSTISVTSMDSYRVADFLRSWGIPVVIGGIHASLLHEEALQHADYVMRGEADFTFPALLKCLENGEEPVNVRGVSYWKNGAMVHNPELETRVNMDDLPIPNLKLFVQGSPLLPFQAVPVATSRGCPFDCTFCCVTQMFGRRYRHRSVELILEELARYQGKHIFFCDDNFAAHPGHTKQMLQALLDSKIKLKGWGAQFRVESARDDELLTLMRRTGGNIAYIGLESINPETLEAYNKKQCVEDIQESIRRFHDYRVRVHGMFVLGSDSDTLDTIRETAEFALETRLDTVQFMVLTPLPGTALYYQMEKEGRILTRDWDYYDGMHVVFQPALMSPRELQEGMMQAYRRFYAPWKIFQNTFLTGWQSSLYRGIGSYLVNRIAPYYRWYDQVLSYLQQETKPHQEPWRKEPRREETCQEQAWEGFQQETVAVKLLGAAGRKNRKAEALEILTSENRGIFYVKLRGFLDKMNLTALNRTLKEMVPPRCLRLVVNTEEVDFASQKTTRAFTRLINRLSKRFSRLQLQIGNKQKSIMRESCLKKTLKFTCFAEPRLVSDIPHVNDRFKKDR